MERGSWETVTSDGKVAMGFETKGWMDERRVDKKVQDCLLG